MADAEKLLYINGLDAATGSPLIDPVSSYELTQRVLEIYPPQQLIVEQENNRRLRRLLRGRFDKPDLLDPEQAGWGLLVHTDEADTMQKRLAELITHRSGRLLLYEGESPLEWKAKNHAEEVNPKEFPYYVLIAGSPTKIPYELQFSLDVLQAVGRVDFDDPDDYARYAKTVVDQETEEAPRPGKRVVFFAPKHDISTVESSERLVRPLSMELPETNDLPSGLAFKSLIGKDATKANLLTELSADEEGQTPALLFSAGHGIGVDNSDPYQCKLQGSIVCQDRKFPLTPQSREGFISGYDVSEGARLPGGIYFLFACYGAGTLAHSDFINYVPDEDKRRKLESKQGKEDFSAYLPKTLLSDPRGGALAVVGHVDPAYGYSFINPVTKERRIDLFGFTLAPLLRGNTVGFALNHFNQKYADFSTEFLSIVEDRLVDGHMPDPSDFSDLWKCRNDAKNYVIFGDPAVRLRFQ